MRPSKIPLPATSGIHRHIAPGDYTDCWALPGNTPAPAALAQAFTTLPGWFTALLALRNRIVAGMGLRTDTPDGAPRADLAALRQGDWIGLFQIHALSTEEAIIGTDDKHLDFRLVIGRADGQIYFGSWIHPHNIWGRIYLTLVLPFHHPILRDTLRRAAQAPERP
ncbi:DUF2867 domain-containing protein [Phaeovulum sp. W22_SRMD_FR3]|uniref:DUF2867 domain-containing protein n=1 Tax=Phaeovulum sp. W22_SRMD_FR3 TaxID=3240274 RepID=UPI003F9D0D1C